MISRPSQVRNGSIAAPQRHRRESQLWAISGHSRSAGRGQLAAKWGSTYSVFIAGAHSPGLIAGTFAGYSRVYEQIDAVAAEEDRFVADGNETEL